MMVEVAALKTRNEELVHRLQRSEEQHIVCKEQLAKALTRLSQVRRSPRRDLPLLTVTYRCKEQLATALTRHGQVKPMERGRERSRI